MATRYSDHSSLLRSVRRLERSRGHTVVHDLFPSKEALDEAIASGATGALPEQFEELDELLVTLDASVE